MSEMPRNAKRLVFFVRLCTFYGNLPLRLLYQRQVRPALNKELAELPKGLITVGSGFGKQSTITVMIRCEN